MLYCIVFLQIRDGPYGFSNLIGKYCGEEFPPEITSKERHLWLHFHSDESIEYSGFQAVYEFIDRRKDGKKRVFDSESIRFAMQSFNSILTNWRNDCLLILLLFFCISIFTISFQNQIIENIEYLQQ